jgi:chromosome segregation ATPase
LKKLKKQYQEVNRELSELRQKFKEWQNHINRLDVQMNTKITKLEIEREELYGARDQFQQLERITQMMNRNNKSLATSNNALLQDNTLFHCKIEHTNKYR